METMQGKKNIVLIGMPGAGKSTVGVVLAKRLGYRFLDSDLVIQEQTKKLLHELITEHGVDGFLKIEEDINAGLDCEQAVIATGGSVIYGEKAMEHLRKIGCVVYLKLSYKEAFTQLTVTVLKKDAGTITGAGDLKNRTITVQNGSLQELFVKEQLPDCGKLNLVSSANDAFLMVQTGRADAAAASLKMAQLYLDSTPESGLIYCR